MSDGCRHLQSKIRLSEISTPMEEAKGNWLIHKNVFTSKYSTLLHGEEHPLYRRV